MFVHLYVRMSFGACSYVSTFVCLSVRSSLSYSFVCLSVSLLSWCFCLSGVRLVIQAENITFRNGFSTFINRELVVRPETLTQGRTQDL